MIPGASNACKALHGPTPSGIHAAAPEPSLPGPARSGQKNPPGDLPARGEVLAAMGAIQVVGPFAYNHGYEHLATVGSDRLCRGEASASAAEGGRAGPLYQPPPARRAAGGGGRRRRGGRGA